MTPWPRCRPQGRMAAGGLLCAASGLCALLTATATDFWLRPRGQGDAIGLWRLCTAGGHCGTPLDRPVRSDTATNGTSCARPQLRCAVLGHCCDELCVASAVLGSATAAFNCVPSQLCCVGLDHCCDDLCVVSAALCHCCHELCLTSAFPRAHCLCLHDPCHCCDELCAASATPSCVRSVLMSPFSAPAVLWDATRALMLLASLAAAVGFAVGLSATGGAAWRARARTAGITMLLGGTWGAGGEPTPGAASLLL